ncbi:hypothetical protein [Sulfurovum sp.]|uniref:hypothetical protein n=1 Tax=Sulfurovum sp. TaxID=1969726 RepID=UPI0025F52749|nr:hypothetical protein [Sulfurovum sp.]
MKKLFTSIMIALSMMVLSLHAEVTIKSQSYQKVIKKKKVKWVKAAKVIPGSVVLYVNTLKNKGKETAQNLTVVNAIPAHMNYVKGTARCKSKCNITYSVDGGKTFNKPKKLFVKDKKTKKRRRAKASEYTAIKWVVAKLNGGKKTTVQYKARLQ